VRAVRIHIDHCAPPIASAMQPIRQQTGSPSA
jgi:hypothetical protein